jgi:CAP12/Pycsar effector protein, TIR domain
MNLNRRVFISAPRDVRLRDDPLRIRVKNDVVREIERLGYATTIFLTLADGAGLAAGQGWSPEAVLGVAKRCVGAVLIGIPFWKVTVDGREAWLASDYCSHEGAVAHALGLPVLSVSIGIEGRGFFDEHTKGHRILSPFPPSPSWTAKDDFLGPLQHWSDEIQRRRDVFFGYCSQSATLAAQIQASIESAGATVHKWEVDFRAGESILGEISTANSTCSCGVFLFSEDDRYADDPDVTAPRDNVVFEAGYFMSTRGHDRCLIIRHGHAKMPADLGGTIYLALQRDSAVSSIEPRLHRFLRAQLQDD